MWNTNIILTQYQAGMMAKAVNRRVKALLIILIRKKMLGLVNFRQERGRVD